MAQALQSRFPGAEYEIVDKQTSRDFVRQDFSSGIYLVLSYVFVILLLLVLLILYVKLRDYVNGCTGITRALHIIGAKKQDLHKSFLLQAAASALPAAVLTAAIFLCPVHFALKNNMKKF